MEFFSVDSNGLAIDNPTDVFSVYFTNLIYFASTYVSYGLSELNFTLTEA